MKSPKIQSLFKTVAQSGYAVFGPVKQADKTTIIKPLSDYEQADYTGRIPENTFKEVVFPSSKELYQVSRNTIKPLSDKTDKRAIWGINILDLKALGLYDIVFTDDVYYQKLRKNLLVIGFSPAAPYEYEDYKTFAFNLEENILEHLRFDVFIIKQKNGQDKFFAGSHRGWDILEAAGIANFEFVQFVGFIPEEGVDEKISQNKQIMEKIYNSPLWDELGKICLACGKCSIHCPTCFCYDLEYENNLEGSNRKRVMGSCFYQEFSKLAGGHLVLPTAKERIRFWYLHKFLRIPNEFKYPGCVGCNRCFRVCPVQININKNMIRLKKEAQL